MFKLKTYQENTLQALKEFLQEARLSSPEPAFIKVFKKQGKDVSYKTHNLGDIPYVCLRLPTGGGKTVLASYAIKEVSQNYIEKDYPLVLWLVPTNAIREQTISALQIPSHPYRQAINESFEGKVKILDISDVELIMPQDLNSKVCIVVGTLATLRVQDTTGRKIYAHSEKFESHFRGIPENAPGLERIEEGPDKGKIKRSFANLCHLLKPLIIMDEAHNARTQLTFETLQRISPSCIIEFTATPDTSPESGSNILYSVTASELKTEEMIKLPIILTEHKTWQEAVRDAVLTRKHLSEAAKKETDLVRPIILFQAENKDREVTVEVLKKYLIEVERVGPETIAIATGTQKELDGIDLFDPKCKIENIITVEALKEGWDCSFAYIFCSVANIQSSRDVEQILGRVLRMPYAKTRAEKDLNFAYAHVSSPSFSAAAQHLKDKLINMGFEDIEANAYVQPQQPGLFNNIPSAPPKIQDFSYVLDKLAEQPEYPEPLKNKINFIESNGKTTVTFKGLITDEVETDLSKIFKGKQLEDFEKAIKQHRIIQQAQLAPAMRGETLVVPRICVNIQGVLELVEAELFLDATQWNPLDYPAEFSDEEFKLEEGAQSFEVDVEGRKVVYHALKQMEFIDLDNVPTEWKENEFIRWIDMQIHQPDVSQTIMIEFIRRILADLINSKKKSLSALVRSKYILSKAIIKKIAGYREIAVKKGYQKLLFEDKGKVETSFTHSFDFKAEFYPAREPFYSGSYKFQKHFYQMIGDLKPEGEEFDCAVLIDSLPEVKHWVRNISRNPEFSFWLPTSTDRFYPDFVAELKDGRLLVIEYKGAHIEDSADTLEKNNIGLLWEEKSKGKGLFL